MRGEMDLAEAIDRECFGEFEFVFLDRLPDFGGGEFRCFGEVKKTSDFGAGLKEVWEKLEGGEFAVDDECFGSGENRIVLDFGSACEEKFDSDSGEAASFAELEVGEERFDF